MVGQDRSGVEISDRSATAGVESERIKPAPKSLDLLDRFGAILEPGPSRLEGLVNGKGAGQFAGEVRTSPVLPERN